MAQPGPRQVFPSNITRINFSVGGDLLFFRLANKHSGVAAGPTPSSMVTRLPGQLLDFEAFASIAPQKDSAKTGPAPAIVDTVTPAMIGYYVVWPHRPLRATSRVDVQQPPPYAKIDTAAWDGMWNGRRNIQSPVMSEADAFEFTFNAFNSAGFGPAAREDWGVSLTLVFDINAPGYPFGRFREVKPYPDPEWATTFAFNGWTWHLEPSPPITSVLTEHTSTFIFNLALLQKAAPTDSATGKKVATWTLRIYAPIGTGVGSNNWSISAAATRGRRAFPVGDTSNDAYMPTWTPYPFPADATLGGGAHGIDSLGGFVDVVITFGTKEAPPSVKFIDHVVMGVPT